MRKLFAIAGLVLIAVCLFFARSGFAAAPGQEGRVLFLIETSSAMKADRTAINSSIQSILDSGLNGQLHYGDTIGVWTYSDKLNTDCPMIQWRGEHVQDIKAAVNEWMSRQKYAKSSQFSKVLPALQSVIRSSQKLTIIWISNGDDALSGTAFDSAINELHKDFRADFHKQHIPFVTVMVVRKGAVVDFTVNPGDARLRLPDILDKEAQDFAAAKKAEAEAAEAQAKIPQPVKPTKPPLIIRVGPSPELVQQKQTNAAATNTVPVATNTVVTNAAPVVPQTLATNSSAQVAAVPITTNATVQSNKPVEKMVTNAAVAQTNATGVTNTPPVTTNVAHATTNVPYAAVAVTPAPSALIKTNAPVTNISPVTTAKTEPAPSLTKEAEAPAPLLAQHNMLMAYLAIAIVVLALIIGVLVYLIAKSRQHTAPSIISQSMTRQRFNSDAAKPSSDKPADHE
jgi:hypothetical protein